MIQHDQLWPGSNSTDEQLASCKNLTVPGMWSLVPEFQRPSPNCRWKCELCKQIGLEPWFKKSADLLATKKCRQNVGPLSRGKCVQKGERLPEADFQVRLPKSVILGPLDFPLLYLLAVCSCIEQYRTQSITAIFLMAVYWITLDDTEPKLCSTAKLNQVRVALPSIPTVPNQIGAETVAAPKPLVSQPQPQTIKVEPKQEIKDEGSTPLEMQLLHLHYFSYALLITFCLEDIVIDFHVCCNRF